MSSQFLPPQTMPDGSVISEIPANISPDKLQQLRDFYTPRSAASNLGLGLLGVGQEAARQIQRGGDWMRQIPVLGPLMNKLPSVQLDLGLNEPQTSAQQAGANIAKTAEYVLPTLAAPELGGSSVALRGLVQALQTGGVSLAQGDPSYEAFKKALVAGGVGSLTGGAFRALGGLGKYLDNLPAPTRIRLADGLDKLVLAGGLLRSPKTVAGAEIAAQTVRNPLFLQNAGNLAPKVATTAGTTTAATSPWWSWLFPSSSGR